MKKGEGKKERERKRHKDMEWRELFGGSERKRDEQTQQQTQKAE